MIQRVGFFKELRHGDPAGPSLLDSIKKLHAEDSEVVARYLDHGATLSATGVVVDDALDPTKRAVASLEVATDGDWIWPRDLGYYTREYKVGLPTELLNLVASRGGEPPVLTHDDLVRVEEEIFGGESG